MAYVHEITLEPPVLFIGDVHLGPDPEVAQRFQSFLEALPDQTNIVSIGDLVDTWAEGSTYDLGDLYPQLEALSRFSCYFLKGNRDFLIGERWEELTGGRVLGDEVIVQIDQVRFRCMHGDTLVQSDWRYQLWRRMARSSIFSTLASFSGPDRARRYAQRLRDASKEEVGRKTRESMSIQDSVAMTEMKDCERLVCGHTHHPLTKTIKEKTWYTVGAWDQGAEVLLVDQRQERLLPPEKVKIDE